MSKLILRLCVVLCICTVPALAFAKATPTEAKAQVAAILSQFPAGGQAMKDVVAKAVEADPSLAKAFVAAALGANDAQQQAIGAGLAEAAVFFANSDTPEAIEAQTEIQAAMASATTAVVSAFNSGGGGTLSAYLGNVVNNFTNTQCVSPSRPGRGC